MRFPAPPEARALQTELARHGVTLKIVDLEAGGDIDQEVFSWLDFAETMIVFGTMRYGENTGNPACTYKELKFAQCTNKRLILLRVPFNPNPTALYRNVTPTPTPDDPVG